TRTVTPTPTITSTPTVTLTPTPTPTSFSVWSNASVPTEASDADTSSVELGLKFRVSVAGRVLGVRFYKGPTNSGTHTGALWTRTGTKLAQVTFANETATGWQQALFAAPIAVSA